MKHLQSLQVKLICLIALGISSCTAFKPISKKSELTETEFRAKITPGKTYLFELKSGQKLKVKVTEIDSINLYGVVKTMGEGKKEWVPFKDSYSSLYMNLNQAEVKSPFRTFVLLNLSVFGLIGLIGLAGFLMFIFSA